MGYEVLLHPKAHSFLEKLEDEIEKRIKNKFRILNGEPESGEKLRHSDFWRLRIDDCRAIYEIESKNERIIILFIGHRREVYDNFSRLL